MEYVIRDILRNSTGQLKGKILESLTPEEFHLVQIIHENLHKKCFELSKQKTLSKFTELISSNKVTLSTTDITDKKKWVINMSSRQLTHIKTDFLAKGINLLITSKMLPIKDIIATIGHAVNDLEKE